MARERDVGRARERDVDAFNDRAETYDAGRLGAWHGDITRRSADLVLRFGANAARVLDVGCGTGTLLDILATELPDGVVLNGIDPAPAMVEQARTKSAGRFGVSAGGAENLPMTDGSADLIIAVLSFDHWADQHAGIKECTRVLSPGGRLIIVDLCAGWMLAGKLLKRNRDRARSPRVIMSLMIQAGLEPQLIQQVFRLGPMPIVQAIVAQR